MFGLSPDALSQLQLTIMVTLVGVVWRLGTKMATMNGTVAALTKEMAEHKQEDLRHFSTIHHRLDRRWFGR